jgi:transposase
MEQSYYWVKDVCNWVLEIVKRSDNVTGFKVLPRRWVVERTFGWPIGVPKAGLANTTD